MSGNRTGGLKARDKNLEKDPNFYVKLGMQGGKAGTGHKFGHGKVDPRKAGKKGGAISKRGVVAAYRVTQVPTITVTQLEKPEELSFIDKLRRIWT